MAFLGNLPGSSPVMRRSVLGRLVAVCVLSAVLLTSVSAQAATYYATPGDDLDAWVDSLDPGDTLVLTPGTYPSRMSINNKNGDADNWFTVQGSDQGIARILAYGNYYNIIDIRNSSYWRFENFEIDGFDFLSSDAIKCSTSADPDNDYTHHIVIDGLHIHHIDGNGVSTKVATWDFEVRNCYIHDTKNPGAYLGNSDGELPIMNLIFENNFIERTRSYNIQVKHQYERIGVARGDTPGLEFTTWGWLIKDNVFMRSSDPPLDRSRPNFLIDAAPLTGPGSDDLATICGNVVLGNTDPTWGESGFQLSGNLRIYNNIITGIVRSGFSGITLQSHAGNYPRNFEIYNNTFFLLNAPSSSRCLSISGASTAGGLTRVITNNALIRASTAHTAFVGSLPAGTIVANNIVRGTGGGTGFIHISDDLNDIFVNPLETAGSIDLYPLTGSPLIDAGDNAYTALDDFNGTARPYNTIVDVGAYEYDGPDNPGWQLDLAFKGGEPAPIGDLDGDGDVDLDDYNILESQLTGPATLDAFRESYGLVVMEAENYDTKVDGSGAAAGSAWEYFIRGGSIGDGYEQALPSDGVNINAPDIESSSPRLSYKVLFANTGTYYLWIRAWGYDGTEDSLHYGLDGTAISTGFDDAPAVYKAGPHQFEWTSHTGDGARPTIEITTPGLYTVELWMREDGARIDRFLLTTNPSSTSMGDPPESPRHPVLSGDLDQDGDVDLADVGIFFEDLAAES